MFTKTWIKNAVNKTRALFSLETISDQHWIFKKRKEKKKSHYFKDRGVLQSHSGQNTDSLLRLRIWSRLRVQLISLSTENQTQSEYKRPHARYRLSHQSNPVINTVTLTQETAMWRSTWAAWGSPVRKSRTLLACSFFWNGMTMFRDGFCLLPSVWDSTVNTSQVWYLIIREREGLAMMWTREEEEGGKKPSNVSLYFHLVSVVHLF